VEEARRGEFSLRKILTLLSAFFFIWAAVVFASGGIQWRFAGLLFRSRDPARALDLGIACKLAEALFYREPFAADLERLAAWVRRNASRLAGGVAALVLIHAFHFGGCPAGGADSYGYVSQAYGWIAHQMPHPSVLPLSLPFPLGDGMQIPLGYTRGQSPHTMVPVYAPGLPLLMIAPILAFGAIGPYTVVPVCAALLVWFTFCLGRQAVGPSGGLVAAIIAATSPTVLYQSLWAMSDVPAGALWTGAIVGVLARSRRGAALAGLSAALGLLVRPNLPLLALVLVLWILISGRTKHAAVRAVLFSIPVAAAAALIAVLFSVWFGSPLHSGYGPANQIYGLANLWPNLQRYPVWLWRSQGAWVLFALLSPVLLARRSESRAAIALCWIVFLATLFCYLSYLPWEQWWYLRFLLPGFGALYVLISSGVVVLARRMPPTWGRIAAVLAVLLMVKYTTAFALDNGVFGQIERTEHRYADVGEFIARTLPPNALVFAMQHSGSIRIWGGRMTLRYDWVDPDWKARVIPFLEHEGFHPYLTVDDWEIPDVKRHFALPEGARLPWPVTGRMREFGGVTVYDLGTHPAMVSPTQILPGLAPRYSTPRPLVLRPGPPA
jgi:hypothetical protein